MVQQCVHDLAEDMESSKCHLGGVIIRDLSLQVSNYRSVMTLDAYLKEQVLRGGEGGAAGGGTYWQ
jgi:carbamoylphosphate synthase small subunit